MQNAMPVDCHPILCHQLLCVPFATNHCVQGDLYEQIGIDPPRGVLLYGPPGTGAASLYEAPQLGTAQQRSAQQLAAVAMQLVLLAPPAALKPVLPCGFMEVHASDLIRHCRFNCRQDDAGQGGGPPHHCCLALA